MSATRNLQQPQWQATRVPKLSYRKPLPQDELDKINSIPREYVPQANTVVRTVSVRETVDKPPTPSSAQAPPRKKSSLLSGFFSKEPTISALAQVEADLTAKHGAATPQSVPHVSSRKMPEHVPKVNSRWDGVPELVKLREREDKERKRLSQQSTLASPQHYLSSRGSDDSVHQSGHHRQTASRRGSDVVSRTDSWQSRSEKYSGPHRHESFSTAASSNGSAEDKRRPTASERPQSLRSPSGNSLPEITSFFPHHQTSTAAQVPQTTYTGNSARLQSPKLTNSRSDAATSRDNYGASNRAIPDHSSSPAATPREMSPVTPVYCPDRETSPRTVATNVNSAGTKSNKQSVAPVKHVQIDAFLAGEARPVELDDSDDDDDSDATHRTRIPLRQNQNQNQNQAQLQQKERAKINTAGRKQLPRQGSETETRTSKISRSEAAPWEKQEPVFSKHTAPTVTKNRVPKASAGFK